MSHEHSEDNEGDEVGVREPQHSQQGYEDGLARNIDDAADAVVVSILNRAPVKPVVRIKDFLLVKVLLVQYCIKSTIHLVHTVQSFK